MDKSNWATQYMKKQGFVEGGGIGKTLQGRSDIVKVLFWSAEAYLFFEIFTAYSVKSKQSSLKISINLVNQKGSYF